MSALRASPRVDKTATERKTRDRYRHSRRSGRPHHRDGARGAREAPEALHALRHLLLPDLHDRRCRHARSRCLRGSPGLHLADLPLDRVLRPVRPDRGGARFCVSRGRRFVRLDAPRVREARGRRQRRLLLVQQPDLDRGHAGASDDRDGRPVLLLDRQRLMALLRRRARVHLVLGLLGDPLVRHRQVDPDARSLGPHLRARAVRRQHDHLRVQERAQLPRRAASSSRRTRCSSRSCRCCSSTTSASSCRARRETR